MFESDRFYCTPWQWRAAQSGGKKDGALARGTSLKMTRDEVLFLS